MLIYAHRGASAEAPENTLEAFKRAINAGADGIEFDVHATADRIPVVIHDRDVSRTTNGQGNVDELTLEEIRQLDAGQGELIPTLHDVLDLTAARLRLYIELKQAGIERQILEMLSGYADAAWLIGSFMPDVLRNVRAADPGAMLWLITDEASDRVFAFAKEINAAALSLRYDKLTPEVVERCRAANLDVAVWTVDDLAEARRMRDLGAVALCTDDPRAIIAGLAEG